MVDKELVNLHSELLDKYADMYFDDAEEPMATKNTEECISRQELAAGILEHFGMLYRYTGDSEILEQFQKMPEKERRSLSLDAAHYIADSPLADIALALAENTLLSETQLEQAESLFFRRDELCVVVDMLRLLVQDIIDDGDTELESAVMNVLRVENDMDTILRRAPFLAVVAGAPVRALRESIKTDFDPSRQWWLTDAVLSEQRDIETELDEWLFELAATNVAEKIKIEVAFLRKLWQQVEDVRTSRPLEFLAADSCNFLFNVCSEKMDASVEFRMEKTGMHITAYTHGEEKPSPLAFAKICFGEEKGNRHFALDGNGYAWLTWEEVDAIPGNEYIVLADKSGEFLGYLQGANIP